MAIVSIWLIRALFSFSCEHRNTNGMAIYMLAIIYEHFERNLSVWHEINLLPSFINANLTSLLMQALRLLLAVSFSANAPRIASISSINCSASWMDCFILQNHISHLSYTAVASQYVNSSITTIINTSTTFLYHANSSNVSKQKKWILEFSLPQKLHMQTKPNNRKNYYF